MQNIDGLLITLGSLFVSGLMVQLVARKLKVPRVTLLLLLGFLLGPSGFNFLSEPVTTQWFPVVAKIALGMVSFLIGGTLTHKQMKFYGTKIIVISLSIVVWTFVTILLGISFTGHSMTLCLFLATIALATAPAATSDVIQEMKAKGKFSRIILGIIAIDDFWALLLFSLSLVIAAMMGAGVSASHLFIYACREILGAIALGLTLGSLFAFLTGRVAPGEPTLIEALGAVFLCVGLSLKLEVSFLMSSIVLGITVTNLAKHHNRPFHAIEGIEWPFMIIFFILAGASFHVKALSEAGMIGFWYISLRIIARVLGTLTAGMFFKISHKESLWLGLALMPQAGIALGMALIAVEAYPELKNLLIPITLSSTIFFELIGPILTRQGLIHLGEVRAKKKNRVSKD